MIALLSLASRPANELPTRHVEKYAMKIIVKRKAQRSSDPWKFFPPFFFLYFSNKKRIYTYNTIFPVYRTRVKSKSETLTFPLSLFTRLSLRHDSARRARLTSSATPLDTQLVRTDSYYPGIPSPRSHNENVCAQRIVRLVDNKLSNAARRPTLIALSRRVA